MAEQIVVGRYTIEPRGDVVVLRLADNRTIEVVLSLKQLERWIARKMREGVFAS